MSDPTVMRDAMADYVAALHRAYLDASLGLPPAHLARLPLISAGSFTVAAIGTRNLHVIGTTDRLPAPQGPEIEVAGAEGPLRWTLRFYDPVVIPGLGLIDESRGPAQVEVRDALGLAGVVYHLTVPPGGGLSPHHAQHAGTGLAHSHASASRDYDTLARLASGSGDLVREMSAAETAGLDAAVVLLARVLAPDDPELADLPLSATPAAHARALALKALRARS